MSDVSGKVWGSTTLLLRQNGVELHLLSIAPGGYCSWHLHARKSNWFCAVKGALIIEERMEYGLIDRTPLSERSTHCVPPDRPHRFMSHDGCVALEAYYCAPPDPADIEREDHGGISTRTP